MCFFCRGSETHTDVIDGENGTEELSAADVSIRFDIFRRFFIDLILQRFQQRLDRFGKIAPEAKKISRALRFGTAHVNHHQSYMQRSR